MLPTDGPSVVIGRTFNHRQGSGSSVTLSNGPQGCNWFQSAMPELAFYAGASDDKDMVYLVLGAGRFLEYKRTAHASNEFKGVNGASGIIHFVSGTAQKYTLTDAVGTVWTFWGSNKRTSDWQLWKKTDAAGRTAYVGDKTTEATALADYNTDGTPKEIFQEYGTGSDERRYTFTYGVTISSVARLTEVKVETKTGGTWGSPTGLTEIGRVSYDYYTASTSNATDSTDFYGNAGDLKTVKIRTPLSDSGSTLSSGVYDERTKYYRYYDTYNAGSGRHGHPHAIKLIVGFEGCRRFDVTDNTFDDDFADASVSASLTSNLKSYADAFFEYESSSSTQRIETAFFNGECGCSGGSNGTYTFTPSSNGSYTNNTGYDTAWCTRTVIAQPDGSYQTRYFDEVAQPLNAVVSNINPATGGALYWVTGVDRDSAGRVTTVHSPANLSSYTHSSGAISYSASVGLVTFVDRYTTGEPSYDSSGELDGLVSGTGFRTGTSGTATYTSKNVLGKRAITVGASTVVRPLVTESRVFKVANSVYTNASDYDATTYTYDWWDTTTNTNQLYIAPKSITTTLPAVAVVNNGQHVADSMVSYLRKDGRAALSVATDGIYTAMKYNNLGLPTRTVRDADPSVSGDFDSGYGPGNFGLPTSSNSGLTYASEATYDAVGRTVTSTVRPGSSFPVKRIAYMYYSQLADHRLATISAPRYDNSGTPTWYGPMSYSITNQGDRAEFSCTLGPSSGITTALTSWIDETQSDPLDALHSTLSGTSRAYVKNVSTTILDTPGVRPTETRKYTLIITSGAWTGSSGTNYDKTEYAYDDMGRVVRTKDPTGTIDRTVYDGIGRRTSIWTGTADSSWSSTTGNTVGGGSTDDMTQTSAVAYDSATIGSTLAVGNGFVTSSALYVQASSGAGFGDSTSARVSAMTYDVRGNRVTVANPMAPHTVTNYDVRRRPTSTATYSSSSGFSGTSTTGTTTNRLGLTETFYDERGQIYKATKHMIYQSGGSSGTSGDSLDNLTWYDAAGRAIKTGGISLTKTFYDRLGRVTHSFVLARSDDSSYSDVVNSVAGDIVLEERQTVYDNQDKTGLTAFTLSISRNFDDTSTTGALDSNADANVYKVTASNITGRPHIISTWYDSLDRPTDNVAYGANGGVDYDRRPSGAWSTPATRGGAEVRTTTVYDSWGRIDSLEEPKPYSGSAGSIVKYQYDDASRQTLSIVNYTGASTPITPEDRDNDIYIRTEYEFGQTKYSWADMRGNDTDGHAPVGSYYDSSNDVNDQVTEYVYGVVKTGSGTTPPPSDISSNRLLRSIKYEEQITSQPTNDRSVFMAYNAQGQTRAKRDQNGTVLTTTYDLLGRESESVATTLGSGIDGGVRRVATLYDSRGKMTTVTQYDSVSGGSVTDQVEYVHDDWGLVSSFKSDVDSVIGGTGVASVSVDYSYTKVNDTSSVSGNKRRAGVRKSATTLKNNGTAKQAVAYQYLNSSGTSTLYDDDLGRVTRITNNGGSTTYAEYRYAGPSWIVQTKLGEPGLVQKLAGASGAYGAYEDDQSRPIRCQWVGDVTGNSSTYYDTSSTYDNNSNLIAQDNNFVDIWSSERSVDAINRLTEARTGLSVSGAISNSNTWHFESWNDYGGTGALKLGQTGDWHQYLLVRGDPTNASLKKDADAAAVNYNKRNERTAWPDAGDTKTVSASTYTANPDPTPSYDNSGEVIDDDSRTGASDRAGYTYSYDAWGRLRFARSHATGSPTVEEFRYNGLNQRIGWHFDEDLSGTVDASDKWRYHQYNEKGQEVAVYVDNASDPFETYTYHEGGRAGRGAGSLLSAVLWRDRDTNGDGSLDERRYYLADEVGNVVAIVNTVGETIERYRYDANGRPSSHSPADVGRQGGVFGPDGVLNNNDLVAFSTQYFAGVAKWTCDLAKTGGTGIADGVLTGADFSYHGALVSNGFNGGIGILSDAVNDNRRGFAGRIYDTILAGDGVVSSGVVVKYATNGTLVSAVDKKRTSLASRLKNAVFKTAATGGGCAKGTCGATVGAGGGPLSPPNPVNSRCGTAPAVPYVPMDIPGGDSPDTIHRRNCDTWVTKYMTWVRCVYSPSVFNGAQTTCLNDLEGDMRSCCLNTAPNEYAPFSDPTRFVGCYLRAWERFQECVARYQPQGNGAFMPMDIDYYYWSSVLIACSTCFLDFTMVGRVWSVLVWLIETYENISDGLDCIDCIEAITRIIEEQDWPTCREVQSCMSCVAWNVWWFDASPLPGTPNGFNCIQCLLRVLWAGSCGDHDRLH